MLTPIDIQNHVLKTTMGGYNKKETDDFIESVQQSYEACYKENHDLKEKISTLSEGLQYYKQMESTLQKALVLAEKTSTETLEAAQAEAAQVQQEAQEQADAMLADAQEQSTTMMTEAQEQSSSMMAEAQEKSENMLNDAKERSEAMLAQAQEQYQTTIAQAQASANALLAETKASTDQMMMDVNQELQTATDSIRTLRENYDSYLAQYRKLVSSQLAMLEDPQLQLDTSGMDAMLQRQEELIRKNEEAAALRAQTEVPTIDTLGISIENMGLMEEQAFMDDSMGEEYNGPGADPGFDVTDQEYGAVPESDGFGTDSIATAEDDGFAVGGTEEYNAAAEDDGFAVGGTEEYNATAEDDGFAVGGTEEYSAAAEDDGFAVGGTEEYSAAAEDDGFAVGGTEEYSAAAEDDGFGIGGMEEFNTVSPQEDDFAMRSMEEYGSTQEDNDYSAEEEQQIYSPDAQELAAQALAAMEAADQPFTSAKTQPEPEEESLLFGGSSSSYPGTAAYGNHPRQASSEGSGQGEQDSTPFTFIDAN